MVVKTKQYLLFWFNLFLLRSTSTRNTEEPARLRGACRAHQKKLCKTRQKNMLEVVKSHDFRSNLTNILLQIREKLGIMKENDCARVIFVGYPDFHNSTHIRVRWVVNKHLLHIVVKFTYHSIPTNNIIIPAPFILYLENYFAISSGTRSSPWFYHLRKRCLK